MTNNIDINTISEMNEKELRALTKAANKALSDIEAKKKELLKKKKEYSLVTPEPTYTFSYHRFHKLVMEIGQNDANLMEKLHKIEEQCNDKDPCKKEDIYPCPECGRMHLYAGDFGNDSWFPKYIITCGTCDFTAPVKTMDETHDAWDAFREWLVKEGYLEK